MMYQFAVVAMCTLALALSAGPQGADAFQLFGSSANESEPAAPVSFGQSVRILVRTVDMPDPYYRSMSFFVPTELNYMLGEYLHKNLSMMIAKHCNVSNITMIVRNDLQVLLSDYDVWTMRNGDRLEVWSKQSGAPTRAQTAAAVARKVKRACPPAGGRGNRGQYSGWSSVEGEGGADAAVPVPDDSAKVMVEADTSMEDEPRVVPDWSEMP